MKSRHALIVFVALGVVHLWPLASAPWRFSLNYNADAEYNAWAIAWIDRTLPVSPLALFDANIFAPEPATLAYSHPIVVPALLVAPVLWLGGSPVLAFNLSLFAGLIGTAWATWYVARDWTGSSTAALVAGAAGAFNVHLLTRLPHVTAAHAWGLPLTLLLADRMMERPNWRTALQLAVVVAATAGTSLYWLALAAIVVGASALVRGLPPRATLATAGASWLGILVVSPLLVPYVGLALGDVRRPMEMVADFSATLTGYLSTTSVVHAGWSTRFYRDDVNLLFSGFAVFGLAALGIVRGRSASIAARRIGVLVLVATIGVVLSLGPATSLYRLLFEWVPPLQGLRAAARFGFLYLLAVAVAAAFGVAWIERRVVARRVTAVATVAVVAVTIEVWQGPIRTQPFDGVPPIYHQLAELDEPVCLVEVPFYPPDAVHFNGPYVLNSTAHWQPVMNGTSGLTPMSYRRRSQAFWFFPEDYAIQAIEDEGATHVMVHLERFEHEAPGVVEALQHQPDLKLIASDTRGHRLYEVRHEDDTSGG